MPLNVPVWGRIPDLRPPKTGMAAWQNPIDEQQRTDLGTYLRELLDALAGAPNHRGKVVLVTSIESGAGTSSVARSLNLAAVDRGMLSVLIEVQADRISARSMTAPVEAERFAPVARVESKRRRGQSAFWRRPA